MHIEFTSLTCVRTISVWVHILPVISICSYIGVLPNEKCRSIYIYVCELMFDPVLMSVGSVWVHT
jgi:hypothetical protein